MAKWVKGWDEFIESLDSDAHKQKWARPSKDIRGVYEFIEVNGHYKPSHKQIKVMIKSVQSCEKELSQYVKKHKKNKAAKSYLKVLREALNASLDLLKKKIKAGLKDG